MTFDETLYARDDEMDEFGDSGAYGDSLEEDYEEEEEEEEAEVPGMIESQPEPVAPLLRRLDPRVVEARPSRRVNQPRKSPRKKEAGSAKLAKKKPAKKKKPARKPAKKKAAKKKAGAQGQEGGPPQGRKAPLEDSGYSPCGAAKDQVNPSSIRIPPLQ